MGKEGELLLIGRRHVRSNNSWMHNSARLVKGKPRHQLFMHPEDLAACGVQDGGMVRVTSRVGSLEVEVLVIDDCSADGTFQVAERLRELASTLTTD